MVTRLYSHPIYLEHITPPGHPERPDRLRAIERVLEDERFSALDRVQSPEGDPATILYAHPQSFVDKVHAAVKKTLEVPEVKKRIEDTGSLIIANSPAEFAEQIKAELIVYKKVVQLQRLTLE